MSRWGHSRKVIREALDDAAAAGLIVTATVAGHRWGYLQCPVCGQRFSVWSSPKNNDNHAKQLHRFMRKHQHEETP